MTQRAADNDREASSAGKHSKEAKYEKRNKMACEKQPKRFECEDDT